MTTSSPKLIEKKWLWLGLIILFHLVLSGVYLYQLYQSQLVDLNFQDGFDSLTYHQRGISISRGDLTWIVDEHAKHVLYQGVVGGLYAIFGVKPLYVFVFQVLLTASICLLLFALGKRLFNSAVGLLAAALWAVYPVAIYYTGHLARATLVTFVDILLIYVLVLCVEKRRLSLYLLAVLVSVLAVSGRSNILLFLVAFSFWFLFFHLNVFKRLDSFAYRAVICLVFIIGAAGLAYLVQIQNLDRLWWWVVGNSRDSNLFFCTPHDGVIPVLSTDFILRQLYKAFAFFNTFEAPNNFNYDIIREKISLLRLLPLSFGVVFSFAVVGFVTAIAKRRNILTIALFVIFYATSVIVFFVSSRFRMPIVPAMILMMAYGVYVLYGDVTERKWKPLALKLIILMSMAVFSAWTPQHFKDVAKEFEAVHRVKLGNLYAAKGRQQDAEREYALAIAAVPEYWPAHLNLGNILVGRGEYDEAIRLYDQVIAAEAPREIYFAKGNALARLQRWDEAERAYKEAIKHSPDYVDAYLNLAIAYRHAGKYEESIRTCDRALALQPDLASAYATKANALAGLGRFDEAVENYRKAITLAPKTASFYVNLGTILLSKGARDEAIESFQKALALNPNQATVHLKLGAIYWQRPEERNRAAYHFSRFLALSPGHPKRPMVEKLLQEAYGTKRQGDSD